MGAKTNRYWFSSDGKTGFGIVSTGEIFIFDTEDFNIIKDIPWYRCNKSGDSITYIGNKQGICIHRFILNSPKGYEIDHINHNPLDNRKSNLRICTHQQNQFNQGLQKNNTSGVSGVSYYSPRNKYRARIKYCQTDIHLGYYKTFMEAVQARNEGIKILFEEYGIYNDVPEAPPRIKELVKDKCSRFVDKAAVFI